MADDKEPEVVTDPPAGDLPKDPPKGDGGNGADAGLEATIEKVVKRLLGKSDGAGAGPQTRRDIEAQAREEAERAVKEVQDAEELKALREAKKAAAEKTVTKVPGQHRRITRTIWGEES